MPIPCELNFDLRVCRLAAIKKAAYRFGGRCSAEVQLPSANEARVLLYPKASLANLDALSADFRNEVLDQELREVVAAETEGVRNLLLAQAFSAISLTNPASDSDDYTSDPLGITTPDRSQPE